MRPRPLLKYLLAVLIAPAATSPARVSAQEGCPLSFAQAGGYFVQFGPPVSYVAVGDFNSDGRPDVVAARESSGSIVLLLNEGAGSLGAPTGLTAGTNPVSFAISDFNGDGRSDLAVANNGSGNVSILSGDGAGHFGTPSNIAVGPLPYAIAAGDFNGDGKRDLVVTFNGSCNIEKGRGAPPPSIR